MTIVIGCRNNHQYAERTGGCLSKLTTQQLSLCERRVFRHDWGEIFMSALALRTTVQRKNCHKAFQKPQRSAERSRAAQGLDPISRRCQSLNFFRSTGPAASLAKRGGHTECRHKAARLAAGLGHNSDHRRCGKHCSSPEARQIRAGQPYFVLPSARRRP